MFHFLKRWKLNRLLKTVKRYQVIRELGDKKSVPLEIKALLAVAAYYKNTLLLNKHYPLARASLFEYLRAAAALNNAGAQYQCALMRFEEGKFYTAWHTSSYQRLVHEKLMKEAFEEAFSFLDVAIKNKYSEAKRYQGLAYIHGWGVAKDTAKGFEYILDSIAMENAWAKATKIIEKLNLNSPEFFKALTQYQNKSAS
jgi:TPR repeat protein